MEQTSTLFCRMYRLNNTVRTIAIFVFLLLLSSSATAQVTTLKLSTNTSSSYFDITDNNDNSLFRMNADGQLLSKGTFDGTTAPSLGAGTRLWWYPKKAAFRVGYVDGTKWDGANVGDYSTAMGSNTTASGYYSTAMGASTTASGSYSTAMGDITTASGSYSTSMGYFTTASGYYSTAMGYKTTADGYRSTAMGDNTTASGWYSTAMGNYVSTNGKSGSFIIGDNSTTTTTPSTAANQMMMRFAGGYILYTNSGPTWTGMQLTAGGSSWSSVSDSTKKENFLYANGEYFLSSISKLKLGSWNYKGQDPEKFRHYGPMAQEIYHYFGNDSIGVIGVDTLLASADMDGIEMIALQALVKRTDELKKKTDELKIAREKIKELENKVAFQLDELSSQKKELSAQKEIINQLVKEFTNVKNAINELTMEKYSKTMNISLLKEAEK